MYDAYVIEEFDPVEGYTLKIVLGMRFERSEIDAVHPTPVN